VENLFERLHLAQMHDLDALKSACSQLIWKNMKMLRKTGQWTGLKLTAPQLALAVLEESEHMPTFCPHCDHQPRRCVQIVCSDIWHSLTSTFTHIYNKITGHPLFEYVRFGVLFGAGYLLFVWMVSKILIYMDNTLL
jgi:hypothetical protein